MKKKLFACMLFAALLLSLAGCANARPNESETPAAEAPVTENVQTPAENDAQIAPSETAEPGRQDGERFETVIILEGMEETVQYEHAVSKTVGFEMDYDCEMFVRQSESDRERFVSSWDEPGNPENYLELRSDTGNAELVADAIIATLSQDYDVRQEYRELDRVGKCIRIEASVIKGTNNMADRLQVVYVIPASDGCLVATEHYFAEGAEGFGRRFGYMLNTLTVLER